MTAEWQQLKTEIDRHQRMLRRIADDPDQQAEPPDCGRRSRTLRAKRRTIPSRDPFDPHYRRLRYCRYADDFLIGVIGPRSEATQILEDVKRKPTDLKLEVAPEKTGIRRATDGVLFLGYEVRTYDGTYVRKAKLRGRTTTIAAPSGRVQLHIPPSRLREFAKARRYGDLDRLKAAHRPEFVNNSDVEIVLAYNAELRGIANYYALALEVGPLVQARLPLEAEHVGDAGAQARLVSSQGVHAAVGRRQPPRPRMSAMESPQRSRSGRLNAPQRRPTKWASIDVRPNTAMYTQGAHRGQRATERQRLRVVRPDGSPCEVHHVRKLVDHRDSPIWSKCKQHDTQAHRPVRELPPRSPQRTAPRPTGYEAMTWRAG